MTTLPKQDELLAAASYMYSITQSAQASAKISDREKALLLDRQGKVLDATSAISTLISSKFEDPAEANAVFGAIRMLSSAMFDIGMITHVTESATKHVDAQKSEHRRKGKDTKRTERSAILDLELGKMIEKGFGGERLRSAVIKAFKKHNISADLATPSLARVKRWATNFRKFGDWRDPPKPDAEAQI